MQTSVEDNMTKTLIKNARWVVTMNEERTIITDGAVAIAGERIQEVGKTKDLERNFVPDRVIDAAGKLVIPGLIEAHVHNTQFLAKGASADVFMKKGLFERIFPYETNLTAEDAYWSSFQCQIEAIKKGATTFIEVGSYYPEEVAKVTVTSGMRAVLARSAADIHATGIGSFPEDYIGLETTSQALERGEAFVSSWNGAEEGRIKTFFALRFIQACSDQLVKETKRLADHYQTGFQTHAGHSKEGIEATIQTHGCRDVERLDRLGVLGPNLLLIHMGWVTMGELLRIRDAGTQIIHCPSSNLHAGYGTFTFGKFPEMMDMGINIALGSDAGIGGHHTDMIRNMYLAASIWKDTRTDPTIIPCEKVMEMATINGAKAALWEDEIGSIEKGKMADITIFDTETPEFTPVYNPILNLVYSGNGSLADTVIVAGKILMEGKKLLTLDEPATLKRIQAVSDGLVERGALNKFLKPKWPVV
jgi:5-methylthioadenosine/S-adenosylhomocysteine deaminase